MIKSADKEIMVEFINFILGNVKSRTFYLTIVNGKLWVEEITFPLLDRVATMHRTDVLTVSTNDVKLKSALELYI